MNARSVDDRGQQKITLRTKYRCLQFLNVPEMALLFNQPCIEIVVLRRLIARIDAALTEGETCVALISLSLSLSRYFFLPYTIQDCIP